MKNIKHSYSGGCHCGDVKFTIEGKPVWKVNCYCNQCQTTSGSAFRSFVLFDEENIEFIGHEPKSFEDKNTTHGRPMINQFCNICGTLIGVKVPSMKERQHSYRCFRPKETNRDKLQYMGHKSSKFYCFSR